MALTNDGTGTGFRKDVQGLAQGVSTLGDDVSHLAHGAIDAARSGAAEIRAGAHTALDMGKGALVDAKHAAGDAAESLKGTIARHPIASIGVGLGVGFLIGLVLTRRS
jgi:ElaB/YqjD/DUF883 family membrane-anchored ribosome-binding protein